jgi:hypothetical protein
MCIQFEEMNTSAGGLQTRPYNPDILFSPVLASKTHALTAV